MNCRRARFLIFAVPVLLAVAAPHASAQLAGSPFLIEHTVGDPLHGAIVNDQQNSGKTGSFTVPPCDSPVAAGCKQIDEVTLPMVKSLADQWYHHENSTN
jgi:hypothetical protein